MPDETVGIDDLLFIINHWGPCPALPDPCPADIAPRTNPDGVVNTNDMLAVISTWGPCPPESIVYVSNGTGGGDWHDPNTWIPNGVPGMERHFDVAIIRANDTIVQSQNYAFTLGYYLLKTDGVHVFQEEAEITALAVDCDAGSWLRPGELEPIVVVRNAVHAYHPRHAGILRQYDCALYCFLLSHPRYPFSTLPSCSELPCPQ